MFLLFYAEVGNCQGNNYTEKQNLRDNPSIVINLDSISISNIKLLLNKKRNLTVSYSEFNDINSSFIDLYKEYSDSLTVISDSKLFDSLNTDLHLIYKKPSDLRIVNLNNTSNWDSESNKFSLLRLNNSQVIVDSLFVKIWKQSGGLPDFIEANSNNLFKIDSIVAKLKTLRKVYGVIQTEDNKLIHGVRFKELYQSKVNGIFSFPILKGEGLPVLIPYKAGYHFSPDIIYTTPENLNNPKKFTGFPLEIDYELSDHFIFNPQFKNRLKENGKELLINNVEIVEDETYGKVGLFNNRSYIDTGIESKNSLQESFTIAAWVKPTSLGLNNSILGKGDNFVVKLRNGFLTFTMAGIKDYISKVSVVPLNEWTHIAITHSQLDGKLSFYINGELTEEVPLVSEYETSDFNILIGTNLWEEFFDGYIANIKIWERELNANEILTLFTTKEKQPSNNLFIWSVLILALLTLLAYLFKKKLVNRKNTVKNAQSKVNSTKRILAFRQSQKEGFESVMCFGKLRIFNNEGVDIGEKLSPLLKRIFIIVFLYSYQGNRRGISTKQLTEFLWPGMSAQKAKNTRGTNINNLRAVLNSCSGVNLVFKDKSWFIELGDDCFCDYLLVEQYLNNFQISNNSLSVLEEQLPDFLKQLKGGRLFSSSSESWLDPFIEKFSNRIIEHCLEFTDILKIEKHSDLLLQLTEVICLYDDLNEKAHQLKLQALIKQGKLSLAYKAHDNFVNFYYKIYKEPYAVSFEEITSS